jgi:hypothetical protein
MCLSRVITGIDHRAAQQKAGKRGLEKFMDHPIQPDWFEEEVRARSHAIWESEGCKDGYAEEHWMRAAKEIESAVHAALEGTDAGFAPPQPTISQPPLRREVGETDDELFNRSAAA